jgi:cell division protein FtsN
MAQDFAKKKPGRRQRGATAREAPGERPVSSWAWLLTGLVVGAFIAGLMFLARPAGDAPADAVQEPAEPSAAPAAEEPSGFVFYTLLPESEVLVPERDEASGDTAGAGPPDVQQFLLQAGSFRSDRDADRRRAELLLLGFDARIDTVTIDGRETWHRVQVGPFATRSELANARQRLIEERIETLLIRQRP